MISYLKSMDHLDRAQRHVVFGIHAIDVQLDRGLIGIRVVSKRLHLATHLHHPDHTRIRIQLVSRIVLDSHCSLSDIRTDSTDQLPLIAMLFQSVLLSCAAALVIAAPTNLTLSDIEVRADKVVTFRSMSGDVLELINGRWAGPIKDSQSIYWRAMPNSDGKFDHPFKVWLKDGSKPIVSCSRSVDAWLGKTTLQAHQSP